MSTRAVGIDVRPYRLALIEPSATDVVATILGRTFARSWLPVANVPTSADLVEGSYTRRMGDAGEFSVAFPNAVSSGGFLWRERFNPDGALQFLEIYRGYDLEFVGLVERVELDRGRVVVTGPDAFALLRRAYERDRAWVAHPRDVIHTYTRVPRLYIGDEFDDGVVSPWGVTLSGPSGGTTVSESGGVLRVVETVGGQTVTIAQSTGTVLDDDWRAVLIVNRTPPVSDSWTLKLRVGGSGGSPSFYELALDGALLRADLLQSLQPGPVVTQPPGLALTDLAAPFTISMERQGRWVRAFIDGQLVSYVQAEAVVSDVSIEVFMSSTTNVMEFDTFTLTGAAPFLQAAGAPQGDMRLPGDQTSYPTVGLRGRYFSIADLQGRPDAEKRVLALRPDREHYGERLDAIVSTTGGMTLPIPGYSADMFAVRWTGAVWLEGGNYTFHADNVDDTVTVWVGDTNDLSQALLGPTVGGGSFTSGTWFGVTQHGAGWFPIIVEYQEWGGGNTIDLAFTPLGSGSYVDPGGTTITRGTKRVIPVTSLTPLGVYDNRVQGQSYFDLVTGIAKEFGYELECTPVQAGQSDFPGLVKPVHRLGRDTDVILKQDELERETPLLAPGSTIDASEQAVVLRGNAKGLNIARGGDLTAEVADLSRAASSLFMLEAWIDAGDVGFTSLLQARMYAELGLRVEPWQEVRGNPHADDRLVDTWPLTDALSTMRWLPGDGVRLYVPDVGIEDTAPRRITQLVRSFSAEGRNGAQVSFRNRPRSSAVEVRRMVRAAIMPSRQASDQIVTVQGEYLVGGVAAGGASGYSRTPMAASDWRRIVRVYFAVSISLGNSYGIEVNGVDRTTALGGPWTTSPNRIDVTAYAKPAAATDARVYARILDKGGTGLPAIEGALVVEFAR